MKFAFARTDGGVSIMALIPVAIRYGEHWIERLIVSEADSATIRISGHYTETVIEERRVTASVPGKKGAKAARLDDTEKVAVQQARKLEVDIPADRFEWLEPDSIEGMTLVFDEPDDLIGKRGDAERFILPGRKIAPADLPPTMFREAWRGDLTVDMDRARELVRRHLRTVRQPLLEKLDIEYRRTRPAKERDAVDAKAQVLRDWPQHAAIEAAKTPEELLAVLPAVVGEEHARDAAPADVRLSPGTVKTPVAG